MSSRILKQLNSSVKPVTPHHLCRTTAYPRYCPKHDHLYYPCMCGCRPDDCPRCLDEEYAAWEKMLERDEGQEASKP